MLSELKFPEPPTRLPKEALLMLITFNELTLIVSAVKTPVLIARVEILEKTVRKLVKELAVLAWFVPAPPMIASEGIVPEEKLAVVKVPTIRFAGIFVRPSADP